MVLRKMGELEFLSLRKIDTVGRNGANLIFYFPFVFFHQQSILTG
jgi:hypothetical protein